MKHSQRTISFASALVTTLALSAPAFAGDTIYAWSEVLETADIDGPLGALRIRTVAAKNRNAADFPYKGEDGRYAEGVILDLDYWALIAK